MDHIKKKFNLRDLSQKPRKTLVNHIALRARHYDEVVREFIGEYPDSVIINIGCGYDHRFERVDNGRIRFFDLDLPEVISLKKEVFSSTERLTYIPESVFNPEWPQKFPGSVPFRRPLA